MIWTLVVVLVIAPAVGALIGYVSYKLING